MSSGFKDDEAYDVYDQPWRKDQSIGSNIYRPGRNVEKEYEGVDDLVKNNRYRTEATGLKSNMNHSYVFSDVNKPSLMF